MAWRVRGIRRVVTPVTVAPDGVTPGDPACETNPDCPAACDPPAAVITCSESYVLDSFAVPDPTETVTDHPVGAGYTFGPEALADGVTRTVVVTTLVDDGSPDVYSVGVGGFAVTAVDDTTTSGVATYEFATAREIGGGCVNVRVSFSALTAGVPVSVTLTDGTPASFTQTQTAAGGAEVFDFALAGFTGIDLTAVAAVAVTVNADPNVVVATVTGADWTMTAVSIEP